jgi:hypothetical protein
VGAVTNEQVVTITNQPAKNTTPAAAHQARPDDDAFLSTFWLDELSADLI